MFISELVEFWSFPFFYRALIAGLLMSLILSWLGAYVVLRREVVLAHALPNVAFLGVVLAFMFDYPITIAIIASTIVASLAIDYLRKKNLIHSDSLLEIFAQFGLAASVILLSFVKGYQVDLTQFLFGDILAVSEFDLYVTAVMFLIVTVSLRFWHPTFLKLSLSESFSHLSVKNRRFWHTFLLLMIAICIGLAMKVVGILLVAAFTTIPANAAKLFSKSLRQTFRLSVLIAFFATFVGLHVSTVWDVPSGASIVVLMLLVLFAAFAFARR